MQKYKSNITTTSGAAIRGAPVLVLTESGATAALFLDRAGTVPAPNPLTTGPDGVFYFYAVNGRYSLRTTVEGVTITDADVVLMMDPEEITVAGPIAEAVAAAQAAAIAAEFAVEDSGIPDLVAAAQNAVVDSNNAVTQATSAANNAAISKAGADSARDDAVIAKNAAEAALDSFDDRYLGAKAVEPTTDNDGGALLPGALYWDTVLGAMRAWSGSVWVTLPAATAAAISNTPAGTIAATTVQAAINEIVSDLAAPSGASTIGYTPKTPGAAAVTVESQLDALLTPETEVNVQYITTENALFLDECDALTGWTADYGGYTVAAGALHCVGRPNDFKKLATTPASGDYLVYVRMKATMEFGGHAYFHLRDGDATSPTVAAISMGYDWAAAAYGVGKVSAYTQQASGSALMATGIDCTQYQTFALHVDRNRSCLNFFMKEGDKWALKCTLPYLARLEGVTHVGIVATGSDASMTMDVDRILIARPNIVAIGDSIVAGHNGFDPNPAFYAGLDDNGAAIWKHLVIAPTLTNNLIINKGIGGQSSTQIKDRITEATAHAAKLVILEASCNDYVNGISQATRTANIQDCANAINTAGAYCVVINGVYVNASYGGTAAAYNSYMKSWWDTYKTGLTGIAQFVDITLPVADGTGAIASANVTADGIHPNAAGYLLIGGYLGEQLLGTSTIGALTVWALSANPTTQQIAQGKYAAVKNTATGLVKLWVNDEGVMRSVAFA